MISPSAALANSCEDIFLNSHSQFYTYQAPSKYKPDPWVVRAEVDQLFSRERRRTPQVIEVRSVDGKVLFVMDGDNVIGRTNRKYEDLGNSYFQRGELEVDLDKDIVLDAGCGDGALVDHYRSRGGKAFGIDLALSEEMKQKPYFSAQDMRRTSFQAGTFTRIFSSHSLFLYYADDVEVQRQALQEFYRLLKPGGLIHITSFEPANLLSAMSRVAGLEVHVSIYESQSGEFTITLRKSK